MTVATTTSRWSYLGDAVTLAFAYTNRIFAASDLKVYVDGVLKTLTTDYAVSGVGASGGGNVTFVAAPASAAKVVIVRQVPATQGVDYQEADPFPAEVHEGALDRLTVLIQQLEALSPRILKLADSDAATSIGSLPAAADRASKWLAFDASGVPIAATPATAGALIVSAFIGTLLDDADAATARATLAALTSASAAGQTLLLDDNGAGEGPVLELDRLSASPAASDLLGALAFAGRSAAATKRVLAKLVVLLTDATDGSEDAVIRLRAMVAGTLATCASFGAGLAVGAAAADPGAGAVNAAAGYQYNGTALPVQRSTTYAEAAISAGGQIVIAHGLAASPPRSRIHLRLKCIDAGGEHGYAQNDLADSLTVYTGSVTCGVVVTGIDATNITLRIGNISPGTLHKTTGSPVACTPAKWNLVVTVDHP